VQHKIRSAKRAARSELSVSQGDWRRRGYAEDAAAALDLEGLVDDLPRVNIAVSPGSSSSHYLGPSAPLGDSRLLVRSSSCFWSWCR
jgi:hypothetical protein